MTKREKLERRRLIRTRRKSITRRRHKKKPKQKRGKYHISSVGIPRNFQDTPKALIPPKDFRLLSNTQACVEFFKKIRSMKNVVVNHGRNEIKIDLRGIEHIDFASTMMLNAICEELATATPACNVSGTSPLRDDCKQYLIDSGFLDNKFNAYGKKYPEMGHMANMKIEKGSKRLEDDDLRKVVEIERRICNHVTGHDGKKYAHINMIKEICGNTVDWSEAFHDQWVYGAKFEDGVVVLVALDLGKGILESISRKFSALISDMLANNSHVEILDGAFERKYGSLSGKPNRNRGLPSIKYANEKGIIKDLVVITNNVVLDFTDNMKSRKFEQKKTRGFNGTLYCWRIDASCYQ